MGYIKQPYTLRWRKALFQVHLWLGVFIGLYVIAICASGVVLVFENNLLNDRPQLTQSSTHATPDWQNLADIALHEHPGSTLANIDMRSANRRVVPIGLNTGGHTLVVYMDSYTNDILKQVDVQQQHWLVETALALHTELVAGAMGAVGNGVGGALLFLMGLMGVVLWWPGTRMWKRALRIKWRHARWSLRAFDMHRTFGFWCSLFVLMWGITGAAFIFLTPFHNAVKAFSSMPSLTQTRSAWKPGDPVMPVGEFIRQAHDMYPQDQLAYVFMDVHRPHGEVQVYMSPRPSVPMELLEDEVVFQPATGAILMNTSSAKWTAGERFALGIYSVHFGDFGGLPIQILWALLGLVPIVLVITAYTMWWNRTLRRKFSRRKAHAADAAAR